jgi:NADPH-dependent F420 reductase
MDVALLGGTGDIGAGLALRLAHDTDHAVVVGSRDPDRARERAEDYAATLADRGASGDLSGLGNADAATRADVVVLAVPPYHVRSTVESVADGLDDETVLVSPAVGIDRDDDGFHYDPPGAGSVTEFAADIAPADVPVVGAFHNLPAARLSNLDADLGLDVALLADDADAKATVRSLVADIEGLRPADAGGLANAAEIESLTPALLNLAANGHGHDLGPRFC